MGKSFQNILPSPYGKVSTGYFNIYITAQVELPVLITFKKRYVQDGRSGRKYWIKYETLKTEAQLDNCIQTQITGSDEVLASDLLHY